MLDTRLFERYDFKSERKEVLNLFFDSLKKEHQYNLFVEEFEALSSCLETLFLKLSNKIRILEKEHMVSSPEYSKINELYLNISIDDEPFPKEIISDNIIIFTDSLLIDINGVIITVLAEAVAVFDGSLE